MSQNSRLRDTVRSEASSGALGVSLDGATGVGGALGMKKEGTAQTDDCAGGAGQPRGFARKRGGMGN